MNRSIIAFAYPSHPSDFWIRREEKRTRTRLIMVIVNRAAAPRRRSTDIA